MKRLLSLLALTALVMAAWMPKPACATQFGMDYMPYIQGADSTQFLLNRNWTPATKAMVAADLNHMNSMGLTCQRLMLFPQGWVIDQYPNPCYFSTDFTEMCANLPEYIGMCAARGITLDVTLGCDIYLLGEQSPGVKWWQWAYGNNTTGWNNYMIHVNYYLTNVINAIEQSPYAATVKWYDISNEIYTTPFYDKYPVYVRALWDGGLIPAAKKGFSVLRVPPSGTTDYDTLKTATWLGTTRASQAKLTDSHSYPELDANDWNVGVKYNKARSLYPNSTTIVGEYAYSFTASGEATQSSSEITLMNNIINAGIPYAMHWMYIDLYRDPVPTWQTGWFRNHDVNQPNDVVGAVGAKLSLFTNGDMEQGNGQFPTGWSGGSNGGKTLQFIRQGGQDCTSNYYYRIYATTAPDNIYTLSPYTAVPACSNIYVNAYIRGGNTGNMWIGIHQYDANGNWLSYTAGPSFQNNGYWQFFSYQHAVGGWICPANPATRFVYVGVVADINAVPGYLDTDAVTISVR